jgi:hypothetical protein
MSRSLYPSQQPNEKIYLVVREHWIRPAIKIFFIALAAIAPRFIILAMAYAGVNPLVIFPESLILFASVFYQLTLLFTLLAVFTLYYLNVHVVSEDRIVDIDQVGLLRHVISELNIETIEDVTSSTTGLLGNLLDYGTVYVQTAGATERFEFENVPHPGTINKLILELYEQHGTTNKV